MDTMRICQHCGKPIGSNAIGGLCPECMMKVGLGSGVQSQGSAGEKGRKHFTLPSIAEVTKHFPQLEILELLGQGGMGAVYKARQPALDRLVALKILPLEGGADPGFAERFTREARALAKLSHPNIVAVYEFGQVDGLHYFVMEYVDGLNLRQLEQAGKLSPRRALEIIPQICEALQFAHDEGVVHRDIKPENVLLDKKGRVKIADFGLAKILGLEPKDLRLTGAKDVMGTPHYMAPEQIEHPHEVDHRADIYSLGVVFYEMLTGELPLGKFQPPSRKVEVDVRLDEIVLHTLEKEPARRYQHVSEVKTDVETIAGKEASCVIDQKGLAQMEDARRQVKGPAIGLLISGVLNWLLLPLIALMFLPGVARWVKDSGMPQLTVLGTALVPFLFCSFVMYAAFRMMQLESRGAAVLASVLAMIVSPGNIIGLPVGIWALVVLARPAVKESFALRTRLPDSSGSPRPGHAAARPLPQKGATRRLERRDYLMAVRVALVLGLLITVASAVITFLLPKSYWAAARVKVERVDSANATLQYDPYFIQTEFETIQSSAVLSKVIEQLDLNQRWGKRFADGQKLEPFESLSLLKRTIDLRAPRHTSIIEIGCWSTSRDEAAEIANAIAESFRTLRNSQVTRVEIVDRAVPPLRPQRPNVPLNLVLSLVLGVGNGILAGAFTLLGILIWRKSGPALIEPLASGAAKKESSELSGVKAARWTARIFGTLLLAFYGLFILGEGLPPMGSQPEGVQLNFLALGLMLLGFVVGWKREGAAALLIASGWVLWQVSEGRIRWNLFQTPLPVAVLYAFCWWATRGRKTGLLVGTAIALAALFGFGRLFLPTNVFVRGMIVDARTGQPVPDAQMRLVPRPARSIEKGNRPDARSAKDGRFTLYVSWYADAKQVEIAAPGYVALTTNLGPRELGARSLSRDFRLRPEQMLIEIKDAPLRDVIQNMAKHLKRNVVFDPQLDQVKLDGKPVLQRLINLRWQDVSVESAFDLLLNNYDLVASPDSATGIYRVTKKGVDPARAPYIEVPPVVIATIPESGAADVDPALTELRVTFSKPMQDSSWSWTTWGEDNFPEMTGQPRFDADERTCVLPVKLQPGKVYATWINSDRHKNFIDTEGRPAVPYLLIFETRESGQLKSKTVAESIKPKEKEN